ncbi:hypothetical protein [Chthonobacter albigriseus]|uniref:hypothetical protein n=1 Tax=Chthonobacter albigriseus TaxID=1683161 RepID=UPI0015EFDB5B|nr:hypothetical protein [Chthonobacter albigriseus]
MELLINAANLLYVVAYFTLDMLRLRLLTVTAATCLAVYFYNQPVPMLNVVAWNVFFIVLNLAQIARLLQARAGRAGHLTSGVRGRR